MRKGARVFQKTTVMIAALYLFIFALTFYIVRCSPLLTDDYIFLSSNADSLKSAMYEALHYGNGRLLGNFLSLFFVNYQTIMDVERSLIMTLLIILLPKVMKSTRKENGFLYTAVSAVLVLGMCPLIFSEVFSWASGFHNYVPPVLLLLIGFLLVDIEEKSTSKRAMSCIVIFIIGVSSQLFLELSSLVNICLTGFLIVYYYFNNKKKLPKTVVWFVSTVVGGAIMFVIPKHFKSSGLVSGEGYRNIHLSSIKDVISSVLNNTYEALYILSRCEIILICAAALTLLILRKQKSQWKSTTAYVVCYGAIAATAFFFFINCVVGKYTSYTKFEIVNSLISATAVLGFLVSFFATVLHLPKGREKKVIIISTILAVFSVGPMLVVTPFGNRCMFMSYIFIAIDVMFMLDLIIKELPEKRIKSASCISVLALLSLACCLAVAFTDIYWMDTQQINYIESKVKEKPAEIEILNFESDYVYTDRTWGFAYCYYNEKQFDIVFKDLPFEEWYANRQAEGWF